MNRANRPERTPSVAEPGTDIGRRESPHRRRGSGPATRSAGAAGRASAGLDCAAASAANSGARSAAICPSSQACSRARTRSRSAPSRNSLSSTCTRGRSAETPRTSRATGASSHSRRWSGVRANARRALQPRDLTRHSGPQRPAGGAHAPASSRRRRLRDRGRSGSPRYGRPGGPRPRPRRGG